MERKTFAFKVTDFDFEGRTVEGYAAAFMNRDQAGDIIHPGAFRKTLVERGGKVKFLWQHNPTEPLGKPLEIREDSRGLFIRAAVSNTTRGRDALALLKDEAIEGLSIGYDPIKGGVDYTKDEATGETTRNLRELKLWEFSIVTFPCNEEAQVMALKQDDAQVPSESKPAPDVTENTIRIRVRDPGDFDPKAFGDDGKFRTITIGDKDQGIQATIGKLEGEDSTTVQSYVFDKEKWTPARAQTWVDDHGKDFDPNATEKVLTEEDAPEIVPTEEGESFTCECIECGYTETSPTHCADLKCPKCGGQMRRAERPGPGQSSRDVDEEQKDENFDPDAETKAGRVLSAGNARAIIPGIVALVEFLEGAGYDVPGFERTPAPIEPPEEEGKSIDTGTETSDTAPAAEEPQDANQDQQEDDEKRAGPSDEAPTPDDEGAGPPEDETPTQQVDPKLALIRIAQTRLELDLLEV